MVLSDVDVQVPILNLADLPESEREPEALRIASEEGKKPFDLTRGPLLRTVLLQVSRDQYILVLAMHHIITDGWSISILFRELAHCYEAYASGREPQLPELPIQYVEYAQWQREYITGEVLAKQVEYWKNKLAGAQTILDLPTDRPRPTTHSWHGATEELIFESQVRAALKEFAQSEGATLFMVSMAAFQALLWRYTSQDSILVGTPTAARSQIEIENLVGFFVNTLVFRADFTPDMTFRDLVRQVRACALEAYAHQDVPFEKLVEELVPQRSMNTSPLFQVMFTFQNIPKQVFEISGLKMKELEFETGIAKFDLAVEAFEDDDDDEFHCRFEYNTDLFEKQTILRELGHFRNLVNAVLKNPDEPLARIALMDDREREQTVVQWNNTATDYPRDLHIHSAFERQAARTPDATALVFQGKKIPYWRINEDANRLAHYLIKKGVGPGNLVGVSVERSPELTVALLGVLKTGAAYVPLDPSYPLQRLASTLEDTRAECVLSNNGIGKKLPDTVRNLIMLDAEAELIRNESPLNPVMNIMGLSRVERAYVLYTSGSSGRPKGVEGTHRGAMNRMRWMWERYPFRGGGSLLPEDECGICGFGVGDFRAAAGGGAERDSAAGGGAGSGGAAADSGRAAGDADRVSAVAVAGAAGARAESGGEGTGAEVVVVQRRSADVGVGGAVSEGVSGGEAAEYLRVVGGGGGRDLARGGEEEEEAQGTVSVPIGRPISNTQVYVLDRESECGAGGSARGDLCWGGWTGAGVLAAAGDDGGAVCGESDCAGALARGCTGRGIWGGGGDSGGDRVSGADGW